MSKDKAIKLPSKKKRRGQRCLFVAAALNGIIFGLGLYTASLQSALDGKLTDEMYFMRNDQAVSAEIAKRTLLHPSLNQLKMLRRLANDRLTKDEKKDLLRDEKIFQEDINSSLRKIAAVAYLQAKDPPLGQTVAGIFSKMSDDQIVAQLPQLQNEAWVFVQRLKLDMNSLRDRLYFWKTLTSMLLTFSTIILVWGSYLIFQVEGEEIGQK